MWKKTLNVINYVFGSLFNILLAVAVIFAAIYVTTYAFERGQTLLVDGDAEEREFFEVIVEIPDDASTLDIARLLRYHELINNEWIFYIQATLNGTGNHFRPGAHLLNSNMTESVIMEELLALREIVGDEPRIFIREGLTNRQVADVAATLGYFTAAEFLYEAENGEFAHAFLNDVSERPNRLEGFLFPDTYDLPQNPNPRDLIVRMLNRFGNIFTDEMWLRIGDLNQSMNMEMTIEDIIIIASIVEREAVEYDERPIVASLIFNRLAAGMPLEMTSTIVYATNTRHDLLTEADFRVTSPYNTFNRQGLPIGAISNPGLAAIEATLYPANTNYLFMVVMEEEPRRHFFTADYDEYRAAIARYQTQNQDEDDNGDE